jgi:hypothetical protein
MQRPNLRPAPQKQFANYTTCRAVSDLSALLPACNLFYISTPTGTIKNVGLGRGRQGPRIEVYDSGCLLSTAALTWSRPSAPDLVQLICCFLQKRQLISWFTVDSTCAVDTLSFRRKAFA